MSTVKEQIQELASALPENVTWEQVRYQVYVREQIAKGEAAVAEGRTFPQEEVERLFHRA